MQIVVAAVIEREGRFLAARRAGGALEGYWEFPGGKVESGENHQAALRREIQEELGIEIRVRELLMEVPFEFQGRPFQLRAFGCEFQSGRPQLNDHSRLDWFSPPELLDLKLAPADVPVVRRLLELQSSPDTSARLSLG